MPAPDPIWLVAGGGLTVALLLAAFALGDGDGGIDKRLARVGPMGGRRKLASEQRSGTVRSRTDSGIPLLDSLTKLLPNPDKVRARLQRTGRKLALGEYLLINAVTTAALYFGLGLLDWNRILLLPLSIMGGLFLPHMVVGIMGNRRIKAFLGDFPEAIDTMCRGLRSGLPVTESIGAVAREMPDPIGIEFRRIADGVHMGKSLEGAMWDVTRRIDTPEFRFLIIAMAIQKETGGNLAETLGNLADLIRRRRQLRAKIRAMSAEAFASAMIIGSLPFIMFTLLLVVNSDYVLTLFKSFGGEVMMGAAITWMMIGWATMIKMIHFEL